MFGGIFLQQNQRICRDILKKEDGFFAEYFNDSDGISRFVF